MYTYQDLEKIKEDDESRMSFARAVIEDHKNSDLYQTAILAKEYAQRKNRTIVNYQKFLRTVSGQTVPDNYSANYKMPSNFFDFFVTQETQYLLGNGVTWDKDGTAEKLGNDFDVQLQKLGRKALIEGVSFGFWNFDHLDVFGASEFAPLYDEENGALMAGVRFWQIDETKPLRATFYEPDGFTEYIWRDGGNEVLQEKRRYILHVRTSEIDGTEIYDGENYPTFPIVPLWGSEKKQSELVGLQSNIDAYDLIKSGFANDLSDATQIYWILKNAGGMDEVDVAEFMDSLRRSKAAKLDDGIEAQPNTIEVPYAARETMLNRLRDDLFEHAMAFDPKNLASGGSVVTAAIKAAYAPLDAKCDEFEYCIQDFMAGLMQIVGISDEHASFTRSQIINQQEQIQTIVAASSFLSQDYTTEKILTILGDGDKVDEVLEQMAAESEAAMGMGEEEDEGEEEESEEDEEFEDEGEEDEEVDEDEEGGSEEEDEEEEGEEDDEDEAALEADLEDDEEDEEIDKMIDDFEAEVDEMLKKAEEDEDDEEE